MDRGRGTASRPTNAGRNNEWSFDPHNDTARRASSAMVLPKPGVWNVEMLLYQPVFKRLIGISTWASRPARRASSTSAPNDATTRFSSAPWSGHRDRQPIRVEMSPRGFKQVIPCQRIDDLRVPVEIVKSEFKVLDGQQRSDDTVAALER